jgi:osmotically-inducible protein OsmY
MITSMARSPEIKAGEKIAAEKLIDLSLGQKIEAALLDLMGMNLRLIRTQVNHGVVTLKGSVPSGIDIENCQRAVASIEGVVNVDNQLTVGKFYPYGI